MIKKTLISLVSTFSIATVIGIASVNAANVELKYNADLSTETEKYVDVCYTGVDAVSLLKVDFDVNCDYTKVDYSYMLGDAGLALDQTALTMAWEDLSMEGLSAEGNLHGRLKVTVPAGTGAFDVAVTYVEIAGPWMEPYEIISDAAELPVLTIGGKVEEEPVVINAEDAGMFTYWQDAPVAQAFFANLTAEQAAKDSIVWTVTDGTPEKTKTQATTVDTTLTGENDVVIGLVVSNAVEGLTATVTVK